MNKMYIVVRAVNFEEFRVVPLTWLPDVKLSTLMNNGINRNKVYRCFFTADAEAHGPNGAPLADYPVRQDANWATQFPFKEGWFRCKMQKAFYEYDSALFYCAEREKNLKKYKESAAARKKAMETAGATSSTLEDAPKKKKKKKKKKLTASCA